MAARKLDRSEVLEAEVPNRAGQRLNEGLTIGEVEKALEGDSLPWLITDKPKERNDDVPLEPSEKLIKLQVRTWQMHKGNDTFEEKHMTAGVHVDERHRHFLPRIERKNRRGKIERQLARKFEPGTVYTLPENIGLYYLKAAGRHLEQVYD